MAEPLPVFHVGSLFDAERVPIYAGPHRVILLGAESVSEARAMFSVLRAKGVLENPHAEAEGFDDFEIHAADADADADAEEGIHAADADIDAHLGEGAWGGWVAEQQDGLDIDLILFDDDFDQNGGGGANGVQQNQAAAGWVVENLNHFLRAIDLGVLLEEVTSDVVPHLVANPADAIALRRLRTCARAIRRVGKELPTLMGHAPVTVANYLKNTAEGALRRGTGAAGWVASRRGKVLARVLELYEEQPVTFGIAD